MYNQLHIKLCRGVVMRRGEVLSDEKMAQVEAAICYALGMRDR